MALWWDGKAIRDNGNKARIVPIPRTPDIRVLLLCTLWWYHRDFSLTIEHRYISLERLEKPLGAAGDPDRRIEMDLQIPQTRTPVSRLANYSKGQRLDQGIVLAECRDHHEFQEANLFCRRYKPSLAADYLFDHQWTWTREDHENSKIDWIAIFLRGKVKLIILYEVVALETRYWCLFE